MNTFTIGVLTAAGCLSGLAIGGWAGRAGWLGRAGQAHGPLEKASPPAEDKAAALRASIGVDVSCLWDPHGCLNTLSRCIISGPLPPAEDNPLYVVSDHLKLLAQLSQSGGWASPARLQEWLQTLVALQSDASTRKTCSISLPENRVRQLQLQPLGMALQPLLRQAGPVAAVVIETEDMRLRAGAESAAMEPTATLVLRVRVSEGRKANPPQADAAAQALRQWEVQVVCECRVNQ